MPKNEKIIKTSLLIKLYPINKICNINFLTKKIMYCIFNFKNHDDIDDELKVYFAGSKDTDAMLQKKLFDYDYSYIYNLKSIIATNPNIDISIQKLLVKNRYAFFRERLASNPNIDVSIQKILAFDRSNYTRRVLALNPNIGLDIQEILSKDKNPMVLKNLLKNPNIHPSIRKLLENNEESHK
jgi:hypothetical protein